MSPEEIEQFQQWGKPLPTRDAHGTPEEIRSNLEQAKPTNWRMEGNKLVADTQFGPLAQYLPTDVILTGTDDEGMPTFRKVVF